MFVRKYFNKLDQKILKMPWSNWQTASFLEIIVKWQKKTRHPDCGRRIKEYMLHSRASKKKEMFY